MKLEGKNVVLGIAGGIAVYKICTLVRLLKKNGANVDVIMTKHAAEFVSPLTFETLSGNPVTTDMFDRQRKWEVEHVSLAKKADIFVIAPATANIIGKLANGIADDMLSTTAMATKCPLMVAPAMNTAMLESQSFQENIETLKKRGVLTVDGDKGFLACGDNGSGRLAEPEVLYQEIEKVLMPCQDLVGKKILITSGATIAKIDPVRFLTNYSSGKMGLQLANVAKSRGAEVVFVTGRHTAPLPDHATVIEVETTEQMFNAVKDQVDVDAYIMSAAPCDYKVDVAPKKIKDSKFSLTFEKTVDIAKFVGENKGDSILVAFSAETDNCLQNARTKLFGKNADFIVLNDVTQLGAGFNHDTNVVTFVYKDKIKEFGLETKKKVAENILDEVSKLL